MNFRFVDDYSDIFQPFVTMLFLWSLVTICSAMLMIQLQIVECILFIEMFSIFDFDNFDANLFFFLSIQMHHSDNLAVLLIFLLQVFYAFGVMFIACEISQRITFAFDGCYEIIDDFDWYLLPAKIQRMLPICAATS